LCVPATKEEEDRKEAQMKKGKTEEQRSWTGVLEEENPKMEQSKKVNRCWTFTHQGGIG
jgi:hypothetical protein